MGCPDFVRDVGCPGFVSDVRMRGVLTLLVM